MRPGAGAGAEITFFIYVFIADSVKDDRMKTTSIETYVFLTVCNSSFLSGWNWSWSRN